MQLIDFCQQKGDSNTYLRVIPSCEQKRDYLWKNRELFYRYARRTVLTFWDFSIDLSPFSLIFPSDKFLPPWTYISSIESVA